MPRPLRLDPSATSWPGPDIKPKPVCRPEGWSHLAGSEAAGLERSPNRSRGAWAGYDRNGEWALNTGLATAGTGIDQLDDHVDVLPSRNTFQLFSLLRGRRGKALYRRIWVKGALETRRPRRAGFRKTRPRLAVSTDDSASSSFEMDLDSGCSVLLWRTGFTLGECVAQRHRKERRRVCAGSNGWSVIIPLLALHRGRGKTSRDSAAELPVSLAFGSLAALISVEKHLHRTFGPMTAISADGHA